MIAETQDFSEASPQSDKQFCTRIFAVVNPWLSVKSVYKIALFVKVFSYQMI